MLPHSRVAIERFFGLLVARWRFLSYQLYILNQMNINNIIAACCVLHNICIDKGELQFEVLPSTDNNNNNLYPNSSKSIAENNTNTAGRRRDILLVTVFGENALQNDNN